MCWQQDIKPYVKSILKESFTCISIIECKHCCVCIQDIYIYEILALFQVHSIAVSNPCPNTSWPVPQVAMPTCPYVSPSSATHHESNLGDTFAFNLPSRCPPETCLPPPPTHTLTFCLCVGLFTRSHWNCCAMCWRQLIWGKWRICQILCCEVALWQGQYS